MQRATTMDSRPDALADVPGICDLPLDRAVVQYRDVHELHYPGGLIRDIGLALVTSGRFASSARAVDLGSGDVKYLNLTTELVILDWVCDSTLSHLQALSDAREHDPANGPRLRRYCFDLALRVLSRRGFTPLTRPILLRIGFRDLCKDLDLNERTVVRIATAPGVITRVHLDYEANALVFTTPERHQAHRELAARRARGSSEGANGLGRALRDCFGSLPVRSSRLTGRAPRVVHQVRFGVPVSFDEVLGGLRLIRRGLGRLVARFEPERFGTVASLTSTFGERATLDRLNLRGTGFGVVPSTLDDTSLSVH